jgi:hypothetical protein
VKIKQNQQERLTLIKLNRENKRLNERPKKSKRLRINDKGEKIK